MNVKEVFPDIERYRRQHYPEAVYCPGKTKEQIIETVKQLSQINAPVILTRADETLFETLRSKYKNIVFNKHSKMIIINPAKKRKTSNYVSVVTAGTTDIPVAEEAASTLEAMGNRVVRIYDVGVAGIHRVFKYLRTLRKSSCVIVCAGMEGALPSVVGGLVGCPVIGVPTSIGYGANFKGLSALLTMLNSCAANVCVVNIDDGYGAGIVAHLINSRLNNKNK